MIETIIMLMTVCPLTATSEADCRHLRSNKRFTDMDTCEQFVEKDVLPGLKSEKYRFSATCKVIETGPGTGKEKSQ